MRFMTGSLCVFLLAGCQATAWQGIDLSAWRLPTGSQLVLHRQIDIPPGSAHVKFQQGKQVGSVNEYAVNCEFRVRDLGPRTVRPDNFTVTRSGDSREWAIEPYTMRFYKTVALEPAQQAGPIYIMCQVWGGVERGYSITLNEMQEALGDYFSFP